MPGRLASMGPWLLALACSRASAEGPHDGPKAPPSAASSEAPVVFAGMCDASGAVELSDRLLAVADDEDNVLRIYDADRGGAPIASVDLSPKLDLPAKKRPPETDIEAATRIGDRAYWITSHGRNSSGKLKKERLRFFATTAPNDGKDLHVVGTPYASLLDDLLADPRLAPFELAAAAELAPKAPGGLNLEGMTARVEGGVWLGFRNPIRNGKALLVPFSNPERVVEGERAVFGEPKTVDLGGLGVRALSFWRGRYLLIAGAFDGGAQSLLFAWDGASSFERLSALDRAAVNPEGFFSPEGRARVLVLSDDGTLEIDGTPCKKLKPASRKRFRGVWITPYSPGGR